MASVKVAITIEQETLRQIDALVAQRVFPNRSRAVLTNARDRFDLPASRLFLGRAPPGNSPAAVELLAPP